MARVAFVGFGEINSPKDLIDAKCVEALEQIKSLGFEVVTTDTVTDDPENIDVERAKRDLATREFDALIICIAGWIPSPAVISITDEFKEKPMILWGLCGDILNGKVVTAAPQAGTTALRKVFEDLGYKFKYIYNVIGQPTPLAAIKSFVLAASGAKSLERARVGTTYKQVGKGEALDLGLEIVGPKSPRSPSSLKISIGK